MNTTHLAPAATEIDDMVRAGYRYLTLTTESRWVGLDDLRAALPHIDRADLDASLKRLFRSQEANLVPESNQKALRQQDRDSALWMGGEWKHAIYIER